MKIISMLDLSKNYKAFNELTSKPKAIIFDWDNTLVDTWPLIHDAINEVMKAYNRPLWTLKESKDRIHKSMRESFPVMFGDKWQEAGKIYLDSYAKNNLTNLRLLPGALELIKALREFGIMSVLVSNKIGVTLRKEVDKLNINEYFFSVVGSMDSDCDKPSDSSVNLALQGSGIDLKKDEVWFVGDTITDIECAINCGVKPIAYYTEAQEISNTISDSVIFKDEKYDTIPLYHDHRELLKKFF